MLPSHVLDNFIAPIVFVVVSYLGDTHLMDDDLVEEVFLSVGLLDFFFVVNLNLVEPHKVFIQQLLDEFFAFLAEVTTNWHLDKLSDEHTERRKLDVPSSDNRLDRCL